MHAQSPDSTVGLFYAVASETDKIFNQYASLTGTTPLPAQWSLGYHQCRWNYVSSEDIRSVQKRFDEEDMPVDVLWLDIEYSEEHKYFIWDKKAFPDPVEMINDVASTGRKVSHFVVDTLKRSDRALQMVVIVDPHLKRTSDYPVYKQASELGLLVKNKDNQEFEGWCWSGSSAWVDFFNPESWEWWKLLFKPYQLPGDQWSWTESTTDVHIWNDMNEVRRSRAVRELMLLINYISHPYSTGPRLRCPRTAFTMADGNTVTCTTSTAWHMSVPSPLFCMRSAR